MNINKKYLIYILLVCAFLGSLFIFNPLSSSWFIKCPFHAITGYDCPGCGTQRLIYHLLHGDFHTAFCYNPFFIVVVIPTLLTLAILHFASKRGRKFSDFIAGQPIFVITMFIITIAWWILRNTEWWHEFIKKL